MKKIVYLIQSVAVITALFFTSCEADKGPIYQPEETNFSFVTPAIVSALSDGDGTVIKFDLIRSNTSGDVSVPLTIETNSTALSLNTEVANFANGQAVCTLELTHPLASTMSPTGTYTMKVSLPEDKVSASGVQTTSFSLSRLLEFKKIGTVLFFDGTFTDGEANVTIEKAEGGNMYRLVSPMNAVDSDFSAGKHLLFTLEDDGTPISLPAEQDIFTPAANYTFYYNPTNYAAYCSFTKDGREYEIRFLLLQGSSLYTGGYFWFEWIEGYPGN